MSFKFSRVIALLVRIFLRSFRKMIDINFDQILLGYCATETFGHIQQAYVDKFFFLIYGYFRRKGVNRW